MTYEENAFRLSLKVLCTLLIVWLAALVVLYMGGMLTLAFYLGGGLAGSESNSAAWMVLGLTMLAWALLLHKGVQRVFRLATAITPTYRVGIYLGFFLSQLAVFYWFILSWMGG